MSPKEGEGKTSKDALFLLEVLVDKITFLKSPCFSDGAFKTCVTVTAPHVETLEICDDDSGLVSGGPFVKSFNSGKSCLFFLKEGEIKSAMSKFIVHVVINKTLPCGCLPAKIQLGKTDIDMTKEFVQARNQNLASPGGAGYQALQDTFRVIGEDKSDTAEIVMFLRISCFGSLIVTKFQGAGGPVTLGAGASGIDRSCNPPRAYQTEDDPCVCGAHSTGRRPSFGNTMVCKGGGTGTCPPARDPYNVLPCAEPEDACFCTGPHPVVQTPLACRNTNQYCLHIPKGAMLRLPFTQELVKEQKSLLIAMQTEAKELRNTENSRTLLQEYLTMIMKQPDEIIASNTCSLSSVCSCQLNKQSICYSDNVNNDLESRNECCSLLCLFTRNKESFYGRETAVFMNIWNIFGARNDTGTQATASVNKSLQVPHNCCSEPLKSVTKISRQNLRSKDVYYFSKKGMGGSTAKHKQQEVRQMTSISRRPIIVATCSSAVADSSDCESQTKKCVNIVAPCSPCVSPDLAAMVSHIKIGARQDCPLHCSSSQKDDEAPVRCSTRTNCRRGVFEVVIRRMNGAPLAKNELMLEWTPPPCTMPSPCSGFAPPCYTTYCYTTPCFGPSRYKLIMCRPPRCKPKSARPCGSPCGPIPCGPPVPYPIPCRSSCRRCCRSSCCPKKRCKPMCPPPRIRKCTCPKCNPCSPCSPCSPCPTAPCKAAPSCSKPCGSPCTKPCGPPCGKPCGSPCSKPCKSPPCRSPCPNPCKSPCSPPAPCSPCRLPCGVRPCPVGYRKRRRPRCIPKVKPHRKRISPCLNRYYNCPIPRCKSLPAPCVVPSPCVPCRPKRCCKPRCCKSSTCC